MDLNILPLFLGAILVLVISPGPDLLIISTYSCVRGFKSGASIAIGIFIAGLIQTILVAFGLGQLMQTIPIFAMSVKIAGALYLAWLGLNMLKSWLGKHISQTKTPKTHALTIPQLIYQGLLNNLMNPKALLFFSLFLPQFTNPKLDFISQILILGLLLSTTALAVNILFSYTLSKFSSFISGRLSLGRHIDGILGLIFLGLAARLAISK